LDLPGCGRSQAPVAYPANTLGFFAATVLGLMDALGMPTARLIGSSLGGAVALETALAAPGRIECLVLAGSAGFSRQVAWPLRLMSLPGVGEALTRPGREQTALALRSCVADPACITEEDIDQAYALATLPGAQAAFLGMLRVYCSVLGIQRATLRRLARSVPTITAPVLVVWGDRDAIIPVQAAARAVELLPRAALVVFSGNGHLTFVEEPARFADLVEQFTAAPDATLAVYRQTPLSGHRRTVWGREILARVSPALTPQRVAVGAAGLVLLAAAPGVIRRVNGQG
jgi:pimeloyl-ACP methyl ester carboxylesterase